MKTLSNDSKKKISESMKKAHKEGRAWNIGRSRWNNKPSYPEEFFVKVINNEFIDDCYIQEYPVGNYSIDFAWLHKKLAIEIDGCQHERFEEYKQRDKRKDKFLSQNGWKVLRIKWIDFNKNPKQHIKIAKNFIDNGEIVIEEYYQEIDYKKLKQVLKLQELNLKIQSVKNSDIDFSKLGWVEKTSKILGITPQKVGKWMQSNMLEFYQQCYKRNKHS